MQSQKYLFDYITAIKKNSSRFTSHVGLQIADKCINRTETRRNECHTINDQERGKEKGKRCG